MPTLNIDGVGKITVGDQFSSMSPEQQNAAVNEIVGQIRGGQTTPPPATTAAPPPAKAELSLADVAIGAIKSAPGSAGQFVKDLIHPIFHPVDTAEAIKNIGEGVLQKFGVTKGEDKTKYADAVGEFFADRYGSMAGVKHAIATDPVGVLGDLSMVLTGGGMAAARAPGVVGKVAQATKAVGTAIDPVTAALKTTGAVAAPITGMLTGTGSEALRVAAQTGREGGAAGQAFRENLRGATPIEGIVADAQAAVGQLREVRGQEYKAAIAKLADADEVLKFDKIDDALAKVSAIRTYKGQDLSESTQAIRQKMGEVIRDWKLLDKNEFHTAEGFDALKQKLQDFHQAAQYGTPERKVSGEIYNAVRQTIIDKVPEYAKIMKGYEEASNLIREMERTLNLNPTASIDTALRKLQTTLRNNVNTTFGRRDTLVKFLETAGAPNLRAKIAGQTLNTLPPRGLAQATATMLGAGGLTFNPAALAALPLTSPRLMGEAAHLGGRLGQPLGRSAFQLGRPGVKKDENR